MKKGNRTDYNHLKLKIFNNSPASGYVTQITAPKNNIYFLIKI